MVTIEIPRILEILLTPTLLFIAMLGYFFGRCKQTKATARFQQQMIERMGATLNELRRANDLLTKLLKKDGTETVVNYADVTRAPTKLYVGNIDYGVTEEELGDLFSKFGRVESVNIPVNRYTGKARGFGFVNFNYHRDAEKAMVLNGSEFKGRALQVNFAKEQQIEDEV